MYSADDRQYEAHLKGKKHIKAAKELRKAMREEDFALGVSDGVSTAGTATPNIPKNRDSFDIDPDFAEELEEEQEFVYLDETVPEEEITTGTEENPLEPIIQEPKDDATKASPNPSPEAPPENSSHAAAADAAAETDPSASESEASLEKEIGRAHV